MAVANTITYLTEYEDELQDRLDHPQTWKEMCDVMVTNTKVTSSSYWSTEPSVATSTRGTARAGQTFAETAETLDIATGRYVNLIVDHADLFQSPWTKGVEIFNRVGALLNEYIESAVLANHAEWTNFDATAIGGSAGNITVSASNVDDIVRAVKREIREANGQSMMNMNGVGIVWRATDFELLEAFVQANGFSTADEALKAGTVEGLHYLGVDHYWSNEHAAGHLMAGVKKTQKLGLLRGTYGRAHTIDFPAGDSNTFFAGTAFYSQVDIGLLHPTAHDGLTFDVLVA
jgi:hypothetical protein